jgi:sulfite exporter TauE/SafE
MLPALLSGALLGTLNLGHCATMCGPWVAGGCAERGAKGLWRYQLGRTASYAFAGALCGHFGAGLTLSTANAWTSWCFAIAAAVGCMWTARALVRTPGLVQLRAREPRRWSVFATLLQLVPRDALVLGLLSVALPCGLLAVALLAAVASGNANAGAAFMLGFVSVSGAALLGGGFALQRLPRAPLWLRKVSASMLVVLALSLLARPMAALAPGANAATEPPHTHCH